MMSNRIFAPDMRHYFEILLDETLFKPLKMDDADAFVTMNWKYEECLGRIGFKGLEKMTSGNISHESLHASIFWLEYQLEYFGEEFFLDEETKEREEELAETLEYFVGEITKFKNRVLKRSLTETPVIEPIKMDV